VGDSLSAGYGIDVTKGWVTLLESRLRRQGYPHRVVNASISGETTAGGRTRLPRTLARHRPQVVILELGANDGLRGLSLTETRVNLDAMIKATRERGADILLVGIHLPPNYGSEFTTRFRQVYDDLVREHRLAYVPFLLDGVALHPELMQADRLHPRAVAQPRMLENVWVHLVPMLGPAKKADGSLTP